MLVYIINIISMPYHQICCVIFGPLEHGAHHSVDELGRWKLELAERNGNLFVGENANWMDRHAVFDETTRRKVWRLDDGDEIEVECLAKVASDKNRRERSTWKSLNHSPSNFFAMVRNEKQKKKKAK